MSSKLIIASLPLNIAWANKEENLLAVERALESLRPGTDIVVLPELFSTGYVEDASLIASMSESVSGSTMQTVARWARRFNVAVAGSFLCKVSDKIYNRAFFVEPNGDETFYDKRHLFSLSSEHRMYNAGNTVPPKIRFRGWEVSIIVCYDLRFPVWCRARGERYEIMLVPANWPQSREYAWRQLLIARAIENQAVYVGANRGGQDDYGEYDGLTMICDAMGKPISVADPATPLVYAEVSKEQLRLTRERLPFGSDADDFNLLLH